MADAQAGVQGVYSDPLASPNCVLRPIPARQGSLSYHLHLQQLHLQGSRAAQHGSPISDARNLIQYSQVGSHMLCQTSCERPHRGCSLSENFVLLKGMVWEERAGNCLPVCGVEGTAALVYPVQVPQRLRQLLLLDALHCRIPWSCATHETPSRRHHFAGIRLFLPLQPHTSLPKACTLHVLIEARCKQSLSAKSCLQGNNNVEGWASVSKRGVWQRST